VTAYPFERCFVRLLNSQRARDGSLYCRLCREPAIPGSNCGANRLLVKHVSGLLPENLSRYVSPVPVAARTVDGYRLGRQDLHWGRDNFSAPFALHHVAHKYLYLGSCGFGRRIWSLSGRTPWALRRVYALGLPRASHTRAINCTRIDKIGSGRSAKTLYLPISSSFRISISRQRSPIVVGFMRPALFAGWV
jgi:hypothetical protein